MSVRALLRGGAERPHFLRWALIEALSVSLLVALGIGGFAAGVHGAPLLMVLFILAAAAAATGYGGLLAWRADSLPERILPGERTRDVAPIVHNADHLFYSVAVFQLLGMVGALLGYRQESASAGIADASLAVHKLTLGLGNGLTATLAGVICSLLVWLQHHVLVHRLSGP